MAKRFGGKFSPDPVDEPAEPRAKNARKNGFSGKRRTRLGARSRLLFLAPIVLVFKALGAEPVLMAQYLLGFGVLILGAYLTREGLKAQEAFEARAIARRPAVPRKILGSVSTGLGLGLVGFAGYGPLEAVIFTVIGAALHGFAFGLDPLRSKGLSGGDFQNTRVARAVDEGERHLAAMETAIARTNERSLITRVSQFTATARTMFRRIESDPRDLSAARKYTGIYLLGARDATLKFSDLWINAGDTQARTDYIALLDDLERDFAARTDSFLIDDKSDLDIEISVLRDRLAREGVKTS
ncbi:hypothetical protein AQS8620_02614 [Aquimixticola soesokkakensis]|uniref:5-bromo-4-chloroindolyl phosphate hydrolysis protein n=1 Tax=Aquimixticola soesokkakensis TaxID=1519096 RepID=A0A1Y5TCY3_9RHOB|nr:5-bromo-4-chloroindolyl phosphate hydrolysis family protein [Aquimixticola soesokkakensis]SLN58992.1 hypothetical protein AQS8620_02614 [Aquimixticola soesokkakensis]